MTIYERIAAARETLTRAGLDTTAAAIDAEVLARHALGWDRARLLADGRGPAPDDFPSRFDTLVGRRALREPVALITGNKEFWGLDFELSNDVLIPRPETELIVEAVCEKRRASGVQNILDVGTGSGCLAVALATEFPSASVVATDLSDAALAIARRNVARHGVADRVRLVRGDLLDAVGSGFDVIVSNPPYVPSGVELSPDIVRYEPAVALYGGEDGLALLERLIAAARNHLADGGLFVVEFGFGQDERVAELAAAAGWSGIEFKADLQDIPRVALLW